MMTMMTMLMILVMIMVMMMMMMMMMMCVWVGPWPVLREGSSGDEELNAALIHQLHFKTKMIVTRMMMMMMDCG